MRGGGVLLLLGIGVSCGVREPACADLACRRARLVAAWDEDRAAVLEEVEAEPDPLVRAALVEALVEADPAGGGALCERLPHGFTRRRCESIVERPHLWRIDVADPRSVVEFSGEAVALLAPGPDARPLPAVAPRAVGCGPDVPESSCRSARAIEAALAGDPTGVRALCAGIDDHRWRAECMFDAVEQACRRDRPEACPVVVEVCLDAEPYRVPCLEQVAGELGATAPPPGGSWRTLAEQVELLRRRLGAIDERVADRVAGRTWAEAVVVSGAGAPRLSWRDFAAAPPSVGPHVRALLAVRAISGGLSAGLATAAERLVAGAPTPGPVSIGRVTGAWPDTLPGEERLPVTAWLGGARRVTSPDPVIDQRIALVEAAGQAEPPVMTLLVEGTADSDRLVRWTAARLLSRVEPDHPALEGLREDPDPLVRARAGG